MRLRTWLTQQFELSRGESQNLRIMEGLRGFAVTLVFFVHYVVLAREGSWLTANSFTTRVADALFSIGNTGVDLFFLLSGYLIYGSVITRSQPFTLFMKRRIERIYPTFTVVFLIYIVLSFLFPSENDIPPSLKDGTIYLIQNFLLLPGLFNIPPLNRVTWSLSYEMFFYLLIPLLVGLFALRQRQIAWRVVFFTSLTLLLVSYHLFFYGHERLVMFIAGILLFEVISHQLVLAPPSWTGVASLLAGFSFTLIHIMSPAGATLKALVLFTTMFVFCLVCFTRPAPWLKKIFHWTPLRWLGNMSYSYYLIHGLALNFCALVITRFVPFAASELLFWFFLPVGFVFTLLPSVLLFLSVERPFSLKSSKKLATKLSPMPPQQLRSQDAD
jgi:exopolysaccharide production protein ExoZ